MLSARFESSVLLIAKFLGLLILVMSFLVCSVLLTVFVTFLVSDLNGKQSLLCVTKKKHV